MEGYRVKTALVDLIGNSLRMAQAELAVQVVQLLGSCKKEAAQLRVGFPSILRSPTTNSYCQSK